MYCGKSDNPSSTLYLTTQFPQELSKPARRLLASARLADIRGHLARYTIRDQAQVLIDKARTMIEAQEKNKPVAEREAARNAEQTKLPVDLPTSMDTMLDNEAMGARANRGAMKRKRSASIHSENMDSNDPKPGANSTSTDINASINQSELAQDFSEDEIQFETFIGYFSKRDEREKKDLESAGPSAATHQHTQSADSDSLTFVTAATDLEEPAAESGPDTRASKRARLLSHVQQKQMISANDEEEGFPSDILAPRDEEAERAHLMELYQDVEAGSEDAYSDEFDTTTPEVSDAVSYTDDYENVEQSPTRGPLARSQMRNHSDVIDVDGPLGPVDVMMRVLV